MKELIFDIIAVILLAVIVHITRKNENKKLSNIIIVLYLAICAFVNHTKTPTHFLMDRCLSA